MSYKSRRVKCGLQTTSSFAGRVCRRRVQQIDKKRTPFLFAYFSKFPNRIHVEEKEEGLDLVFETIRKINQGDYACKAVVRGQEVEKKITLSVFSQFHCQLIRSHLLINWFNFNKKKEPLNFGETGSVQYATEGLNFTIRCDVGGDPNITTTWKFRGRTLRLPCNASS